MTVKFKMSLTKIKGSLKVTIPKPIVDQLGLKPKEKVFVYLTEDNRIVIEKN